jgi:hypothetical protein
MKLFYAFITALLLFWLPADTAYAAKPVPKSYSAPKAPGTIQNVAYTGTAGQSAAFAASTRLIRIVCSTACHVLVGADPTATSSNGMYLGIGFPEFLSVSGGEKISAVQASAGGTLSIAEFANP